MKKITQVLLAVVAGLASLSANAGVMAPSVCHGVTVSRADETTYPVGLDLKAEDGASFTFVMAYAEVNGEIFVAGAQENKGVIDLSLPAGTYSFMAYGKCDSRSTGIFILVQDNVEFKEGTTVKFDTADATYRTGIRLTDANGGEVRVEDVPHSMDYVFLMGMFKDQMVFQAPALVGTPYATYMRCNTATPSMSFRRVDVVGGDNLGLISMLYKIDFGQAYSGPKSEGWQTTDLKFQPTPLNKRFQAFYEEMKPQAPDEVLLSIFPYVSVFDNNIRVARQGFLIEGDNLDGGKISMWADPMIVNTYVAVDPTGDYFPTAGVNCMPVRRGDDGLETYGVNLLQGHDMLSTATSTNYGKGCPFFNKPVDDKGLRANAAPAFVVAPYNRYPKYNFVGRYGENLEIDAFDLLEVFDADMLEMWGGQTNNIVLKKGGETVSTDRGEYPGKIEWDAEGDYELTVTTRNMLIDGTIEGETVGTISWNASTNDNTIPSVTALSFIDNDGNITDRFATGNEGALALYCSAMKGDFGNVGYYFEWSPVESLKVEYSPAKADTWSELVMTPDPALDYVPGFGNYYEGSLLGVRSASADGWYDLRVTVTCANGCKQTQTIAPAFKMDELGGIEAVSAGDADAGPVAYYSLQGQRLSAPVAGQLVIERLADGSCRKILVK